MCRNAILVSMLLVATASLPAQQPVTTASAERALLDRYCVTCHNQRLRTGGLALDQLDPAHVELNPERWEKVVRKLRAGMMPQAGAPRPDAATYASMITYLEGELDRHVALKLPQPGLHRLNRAEYSNAIRDVLALDVDAAKFLPSDDSTHGFDNQAGTLTVSPAAHRRLPLRRRKTRAARHGRCVHASADALSRSRRHLAGLPHRRPPLRHARRYAGDPPVPSRRRVRTQGVAREPGQHG